MRLALKLDINPLRHQANKQIDAAAELARARFITTGPGQALVYAEKEREAEIVATEPDISPNRVPYVAAEAAFYSMTMFDTAVVILTQANKWRTVSPGIERIRLSAKDQIAKAMSPKAINDIVDLAEKEFATL